jgi:NADH-quinone oxidoreductase subunit C
MTAPADLIASLQAKFPQATPRPSADHPAINVPAADAVTVLQALRDEFGFDMLVDVTAIDWAEGTSPRFTVVWHLLATTQGAYLRVAADCVNDADPAMATVTSLWGSADWHERETYDLLGITFTGHPDLRRILMWDGYPYHPLRKDFPLAGIETELPDLEVAEETKAKVLAAPMMGGPFVASSGEMNLTEAEPRAKDESWNERSAKPE